LVRRTFGDTARRHASEKGLALLVRGTAFQIKVWEALLRIPAGRVVSYRDLARHVGRATAARAVGSAVGQNPVAYLIPCHRVIRGTGVLGEYRWGSARKKALLGWEAARRESS
jgi:AraC family transcriptional regulator of adaptative response/methylated-DNA-[protein]-cysteine methyltransferase